MIELGLMKFFLGIEVSQEPGNIFISETKYTREIPKAMGMTNDKKSLRTLMEVNLKLSAEDAWSLVDERLYRKLVGSLIFLCNTRLDIKYAVGVLSRFSKKPWNNHWNVGMQILQESDYQSKNEEVSEQTCISFDRRRFSASLIGLCFCLPSRYFPAHALTDQVRSVEDFTPPVAPLGKLTLEEERLVNLFEKTTYSVVNIFDVTLRPQANLTGSVEVPEGNGSGIIWDKEGHIVTNYHVIGSSLSKNVEKGEVMARVTVLSSDGYRKNYEAVLVGADKTKDLAVLKIDAPAEFLQPIPLGQSARLRVGQKCLAIGNPFGFDHTLTVGVVSGLNRDIYSQTGTVISGGIQTDAAINPGNSGGPLLDSKGKLIGINTSIFTRTGTSAGVGFAIPADEVLKVVPQLIAYGRVVRPGLNVQLAPDAVAKQLNVKSGALILSVPAMGAGSKAGLLPTRRGFAGSLILGDIIIAVGDYQISNAAELTKVLDSFKVGDEVELKVQRDDKTIELPLVLEESST